MEIDKFSQESQMPQHIIRYCVELGLLVPEVRNRQYSFNEDCRTDMKLIEKSRAVGFPSEDVRKILSFRGLSSFANPEDNGELALYIEEYLREPEQEKEQREQGKRCLEKRTADLEP